MIPRIEQKAELLQSNYGTFINWLIDNNFNILYPERVVSSIYFDNDSMESYRDTKEANTPRKKIRIRSYGNDAFKDLSKKIKLEIKLSNDFYRLKSQKVDFDLRSYLKDGIIDSQYGLCLPVAKITYDREYYFYKNWRVTIDKNIKYESLKNKELIYEEKVFVLEIKTSINENQTKLRNFFEFPRSKFSKYEKAIDAFQMKSSVY